MIDINSLKESFNIIDIGRTLKYKMQFKKENPTYFQPDGLVAFVGAQGSGKTLSAVNYVVKLMEKYPRVKLVTNIDILEFPVVTYDEWISVNIDRYNNTCVSITDKYNDYKKENRVFRFCNDSDFKEYSNGIEGVIFFVDEIQLYLNSLESKNINLEVITQISQQRKQRKHIVATTQVFGRMAKPLREQFSSIVLCTNYLTIIQRNKLIDRDSIETENTSETTIKGKVKKNIYYIHKPSMYKRYDTYSVISKNKFKSGNDISIYKGGVESGITGN